MFAGNASHQLENSFIIEFVFSHPSWLHLKSGDQRSISPLLLLRSGQNCTIAAHVSSSYVVVHCTARARGHGRVAYPLPLSVGPGGGGVAGLVGRRRRSFGSPISQTGQTDRHTGMGKKTGEDKTSLGDTSSLPCHGADADGRSDNLAPLQSSDSVQYQHLPPLCARTGRGRGAACGCVFATHVARVWSDILPLAAPPPLSL